MLASRLKDPAALLGPAPLEAMRSRRQEWLARAESLKPDLKISERLPVGLVSVVSDPAAFQGCRMEPRGAVESILGKPLKTGDSFILDFGEHLTGRLAFSLVEPGEAADAPLRLALVFAEMPCELEKPFDPYPGTLVRSWLQDEVITLDHPLGFARVPRRCAFRYVKLTVLAVRDGRTAFEKLMVEAQSAVGMEEGAPVPPGLSPLAAAIDLVSRRTLRECMHTVFEDGPKRDRRLWLGDLRLQALANGASFRRFDLVKRCLYLFAALPLEDGLVSACVYDEPRFRTGNTRIPDYAALFASTVLEYIQESGDRAIAAELWPVAARQAAVLLSLVGDESLAKVPEKGWWLFFDWNPELDRQAPLHAAILLCLRRTALLARIAGVPDEDARVYGDAAALMEAAARKYLYDEAKGFFVSGASRQVSVLSQAWMILAGACTPAEGEKLLTRVLRESGALPPVSPYGWHYLMEACALCGGEAAVAGRRIMEDYWGGMLDRGADTFWEVFDPKNEFLSPYGDHRMNSYCHAWSCSPLWFIRKR